MSSWWRPGPFTDLVAGAVTEVTKRKPELSTTGGTSDARFIKNYCPVVEFGLVGQTMHQTDERVPVADLAALTAIYRRVLEKYFGYRPLLRSRADSANRYIRPACAASRRRGRPILETRLSGAPRMSQSQYSTRTRYKPVRRRDRAAGGAVARLQRRRKILGAPAALAHQSQRADHRAHLVMQERARRRGDADLVAFALHIQAIERLHRRFGLAFGGAERGEVVFADQALRGAMHRGGIEQARHPPGAAAVERQIGAAVDDAVEIVPRDARKSARRNPPPPARRQAPRPDAAAIAR